MSNFDYSAGDREHLWHPYTRHSSHREGMPLITRGEGVYLFDAEGNRYLDAISSWWACALGHGHPAVVEAIRSQAAELQHSILGGLSHPRAVELAHALAGLMPDTRRHVHFASDGASAVETALKIAIQYHHNCGRPERTRFASLQHAYHGDTLATLSLGFLPGFHHAFERVRMDCIQLPVPPYDADETDAMRESQQLIEEHRDTLAALVVEPLCQGSAGMRMYSPDYLRHLDACCEANGIPLIVDEIATGFGRTGHMFAFEHAGIDPHLVCVGKALSAGYLPISAAIVRDEIYETFADEPDDHTFYHGHTFAGNPVAAAAALATLRVLQEERLPERALKLGARLDAELASLRDVPGVRDVRTLGLIGAVEFTGNSAVARARQVQLQLRDKGILVRPLGPVVYLMPPLVIPEETLWEVAERLKEAIISAD